MPADVLDGRSGVEVETNTLYAAAGLVDHRALVDDASPATGQTPGEDVLGDAAGGSEAELLVRHRNSARPGRGWGAQLHRAAPHLNLTRVVGE